MRGFNIFRKVISFWTLDRWHPEVAIRYLPVVAEIKKRNQIKTVLEVGSGGLGIAPYLGQNITGVDPLFYPPFHKNLKQVKGTAENLPFKNRSFDIVICIDMLEHLKFNQRAKAIEEMLRVGKDEIVIGVPCGKQSHDQDILLNEIYKKKYKKGYHFLEEQIENGLPEENDIVSLTISISRKLKRKIHIKVIGNENLSLRLFLMRGWMEKNIFAQFFYRKLLLLFVPLFSIVNKEPYYRKMFFVTLYENRN